jgi:hypothetical protein
MTGRKGKENEYLVCLFQDERNAKPFRTNSNLFE